MRKISLSIVVVMLMVLVLGSTVYANEVNIDKIIHQVEKANLKIEKEIDKAVENAEGKSEEEIDKIIDKLIEKTNKISKKTIEEAAEYGVVVECYLVEVEIGGRSVWVDPLSVIGW